MKTTYPENRKLALPSGSDDADLVAGARRKEPEAFRAIMRRYNQQLFRIARGVVRDDSVAEDIVQETYVRAFQHLDQFRGEALLSTWLHRIALNEALGRLRQSARRSEVPLTAEEKGAEILRFPAVMDVDDPEKAMAQRQIVRLVEEAMDTLPESFRLVFIARVVEGMSIDDTASLLGIRAETVKTRLHRARALLRRKLDEQIGPAFLDVFPFAGWRCERLTEKVINRLGLTE
ncbi:RNA polymerase sigma factor [Rhizobium sp. P32RR-XVIII]|uniref:RNA polymerase sigma factor n=1 Tax=Rhizobium sp. P32RR-XVIII TaxID=2726738 RepID=UPI00145671EB|nr:RNA polymerase sigma factor [Rhizobium sp. P32RR-XVIII]NLS04743.1 RNA polymerase sigma factor [Rhizobium sp. P32RR-XVIII]